MTAATLSDKPQEPQLMARDLSIYVPTVNAMKLQLIYIFLIIIEQIALLMPVLSEVP